MGAEDRRHAAYLRAELLDHARRFSFIQVMRLLRRYYMSGSTAEIGVPAEERSAEAFWRHALKVRPDLSLAFPPSDVVGVERPDPTAEDVSPTRFRVTAAFLGLYGASSPLPTFYTEDLMEEAGEDRSVSRDFLDIVNGPLYLLVFQCWRKYRLGITIAEEESSRDLDRLFCLIGLGDPGLRDRIDRPETLIRYAGLLTQAPRSAVGLERFLGDAMETPGLTVIPAIPRRALLPVDQRTALGTERQRLGRNCFLGRRIADRMGKIRIRVASVTEAEFRTWLPDGLRFGRMRTLVAIYLDQPLEWELEVVLADGEAATTRPGDSDWGRLGWNTWLFSNDFPKAAVGARFHPGRRGTTPIGSEDHEGGT